MNLCEPKIELKIKRVNKRENGRSESPAEQFQSSSSCWLFFFFLGKSHCIQGESCDGCLVHGQKIMVCMLRMTNSTRCLHWRHINSRILENTDRGQHSHPVSVYAIGIESNFVLAELIIIFLLLLVLWSQHAHLHTHTAMHSFII